MKCAELSPAPLHSVHRKKKGRLHEQSTLLPDHAASLGHKRDFSRAPQKVTNGTSWEEFISPQGASYVRASGLGGPGGLSVPWMPHLINGPGQNQVGAVVYYLSQGRLDREKKKTPLYTFASKCSPAFYSSTAFVSLRALLSSLYKSGSGICICPRRRYTISRLS